MDRAYASGASGSAPVVPTAPSIGYPTAGNPAAATPATKPGSWWYHMITEELMAVVVAGGLAPAYNTLTQLRDALYALFGRLGAANVWTKGQRGAESALPATTGTVTLDLAASNNWGGTLTGNIVLANPSPMPVGQSGVIRLVNGTPPVTIAYGNCWKPVDGATLPALTAVAAACDDLVYYVESSTRIIVGRVGGSV